MQGGMGSTSATQRAYPSLMLTFITVLAIAACTAAVALSNYQE